MQELTIVTVVIGIVVVIWVIALLCIPFFLWSISSSCSRIKTISQKQVALSEQLLESLKDATIILNSMDEQNRRRM